jgi:ribose transport system permease protein
MFREKGRGNVAVETLKRIVKNQATTIAFLTLVVLFSLAKPNFFTVGNLFNILDLISLISITSVAMCFVLMMGSIDLSVEGVIGLTSIIAGYLVKNLVNGNNFGYLAFPVCMAAGAMFGLLSGVMVTWLKMPSFMVTLGIGFISSGIGVLIAKGTPIVIADWNYRAIAISRFGPVPTIFVVSIVVVLIAWLVNQRTILGRHIIAIGGDESIVKDVGVHTDSVKRIVFVIAGGLYGLVGALLTAKLGSGDISAPLGFTFDSIGSCVLGGIAITGGIGNIPQAIAGVLIFTILRNGMILLGVSPYIQQAIIGILLIATVAVTIDRKKILLMK